MNRYKIPFSEFANDLYDLLGKNGMTQNKFFYKYVEADRSFQLDEEIDRAVIWFDDVKITIERI